MSINIKIKNSNEVYIIVPNEYFIDDNITNEELVVYCLLQRNYISARITGTSSINLIKEYMYIENRNPRIIESIKNGIKGLLNKKIIYNLSDVHNNEIKFEDLKNDTYFNFSMDFGEQYFQVYDYTLNAIFKYLYNNSSNINKFALARYFLAVNRVLNSQADFGWLTQSRVKKLCGKSETIQRYNKILQDKLNLIMYNNSYMTQEKHYISTYFGWYGDNENFDNQLKNQVAAQNLILNPTDKVKSNTNRSIKQKINKTKDKIQDTSKDEEIALLKAQIAQLEAEHKQNNIKSKPSKLGQQQKIDEEYTKKDYIFNVDDDIWEEEYNDINDVENDVETIKVKNNNKANKIEEDSMLQFLNENENKSKKLPFDGFGGLFDYNKTADKVF